MIHAENVTKRYGKLIANDSVGLDVGPGELAVLLGPNGAGKSTIIKSICGLLRFQGATSSTDGRDASIRVIHRGDWQVDALAYVQDRNFTNRVVSATSFLVTLDQYDTAALGLGGKVELRPPVGRDHVLRIGGDVRRAQGTLFEDAYSARIVTTHRKAGGDETTGAPDVTLLERVLSGLRKL